MPVAETLAVLMVVAVCVALLAGYPVALTLGGVSLAFAVIGHLTWVMNLSLLGALPQRIFGVMTNEVLLAIPLFIFMGVMLERSQIAEELLETMARLFGSLTGGLAIAVLIVGVLLAAAKGIVGATTVAMGLIVLPTMLRHGYDPRLAAGTVAATATLAQIFPPATVLVLLGDQMSNAYQSAQLSAGHLRAATPSRSPTCLPAPSSRHSRWSRLYLLYLIGMAVFFPKTSPAVPPTPGGPHGLALAGRLTRVMVAPILLILAVLGSILGGVATPTEAASVGAVGAILLALVKLRISGFAAVLGPVTTRTAQITSMIFLILIGATLFSLVFRGLGGDDLVQRGLGELPGGAAGAILAVMIGMFLLGFVMDAFEIIFVVIPIVAPALLKMPGVDPVWLGIDDGAQPADLLHAPPARPNAVLPARGRAAGDHHPAHLCRGHPVRAHSTAGAGGPLVRAGPCDLAAA